MAERERFKLSRLREIGWSLWDPIGLSGFEGTPDDEYDSYLLQAADQLWNGASAEDVSAYLTAIEIEHMGLDDTPAARKRAASAAAALGSYVAGLRKR